MANGPSFDGSPWRTATSAPLGTDGGAGDHFTSLGATILWSSAAKTGSAKADAAARASAAGNSFIAKPPLIPHRVDAIATIIYHDGPRALCEGAARVVGTQTLAQRSRRIYVDPRTAGSGQSASAARLCRPVPADPRRSSAR